MKEHQASFQEDWAEGCEAGEEVGCLAEGVPRDKLELLQGR